MRSLCVLPVLFLAVGCGVHSHSGLLSSTDFDGEYELARAQLAPIPAGLGTLYLSEPVVDNQGRQVLSETQYSWGAALDAGLFQAALADALGKLGCPVELVVDEEAFLADPPRSGQLLRVTLDEAYLLSTGREYIFWEVVAWLFTGWGAFWVHDCPFVLSFQLDVELLPLASEGPAASQGLLQMESPIRYEDSLNFIERVESFFPKALAILILPPAIFPGDRATIQAQLLGGALLEPSQQLVRALIEAGGGDAMGGP